MKIMITINIPVSLKCVFWLNCKNRNIINIKIFNENKKLQILFNTNNSNINFDKWGNSIVVEKKKIFEINNKFSKTLYKFLKSWDIYFFKKIKFKGKGFRIRFLKRLKLVKFFFGKSHKTFIFFKKIFLKKINKYKFILKGLKHERVIVNAKKITNIRPINFYTLRGLRESRQIICKRKGKKGTYI